MQPRKPHMSTFKGAGALRPGVQTDGFWCWDDMTARVKNIIERMGCSRCGRSQTGPRQAGCSPSPQPLPGCRCCPPGGPEPKLPFAGRLVPHPGAEDAVEPLHLQDRWAGEATYLTFSSSKILYLRCEGFLCFATWLPNPRWFGQNSFWISGTAQRLYNKNK